MPDGNQLHQDADGGTDQRESATGSSGETQDVNKESEGPNKEEYLVRLDFDDEAERKRVEYLLNNQEDIEVSIPRGFVRIVETGDLAELYEDLSAKVNDVDDLEVDRLAEVDTTPSERERRFTRTTDVDADRIDWLFESVVKKRDAALADPQRGVYNVSTRKGNARCWYEFTENPDGTAELTVYASGYGEAPDTLIDFLQDEMEGFL